MSVCIIGGTGFIGRHLCEHFHRRSRAAVSVSRTPDDAFLRRYAPSVRSIPLNDPSLWKELRDARCVVYLATNSQPSVSWRAPEYDIETNVIDCARFFRRLLDENPSCRIIYASSGGTVYGPGHTAPIEESARLSPSTAYALGKCIAESVLNFLARIDGASVFVLRLANPVGYWQLRGQHGFVATTIKHCLQGESLRIFGDGLNMRDYFDIDDLSQLIDKISTATPLDSGVYNIGSGIGRTERDIIRIVSHTIGREIRHVFHEGRPFDTRYAVLDCNVAARALGWRSETAIEESVVKIAASYENISRL